MLPQRLDQRSKPIVVHDRLTCRCSVEIDGVDDSLEPGVLTGHSPDGVSEGLAKPGRLQGDGRPATHRRQVEPD